ncbi:MAG: hypothetical protein PUC99_08890 [Eubacteriales bacterium]|nr:hypothetical protein [Lachnospiraceae bacterium]MDD5860434.1 hypothetical protein [Eubacteriales bacterium]MCH4063518.1 hypothetical protein [Lachnospiraceae bacterium]MCH4104666.1 hypothetical protein [Lachnospiraceae bacterium]MCI1310055.1 hypothetical protein [Lachnospiraceae bacterium]
MRLKIKAARLSKVRVFRTGNALKLKMKAARLSKVRVLRTGHALKFRKERLIIP